MRCDEVRHHAAVADTFRRHVVPLQRGDQRADGAGHDRYPAERLLRNGLGDTCRIEAVLNDHAATGKQGAQRGLGAAHMIERRPAQDIVGVADAEVERHDKRSRDLGAMTKHRAFGQSGCAARVEDEQRVLRIDVSLDCMIRRGVESALPFGTERDRWNRADRDAR